MLSYEDSHCKRCGKVDSLAWMQRGLCSDCWKKERLEEVRASLNGDEPDTFSDEYIVCPYCGAVLIDSEDVFEFPELYDDGEHQEICEECGKKFKVETMVSYSWETHKMEE
ncbi:hypothetical protein [Limosilactobacillus galli]|uniref:hypothetical protein n=1 Tax=Limosilactobacillus galli TaxID=2991834 RepID=UPI0024BB2CC4|nr:hypothetical protein [Limosilactobacillus galli]